LVFKQQKGGVQKPPHWNPREEKARSSRVQKGQGDNSETRHKKKLLLPLFNTFKRKEKSSLILWQKNFVSGREKNALYCAEEKSAE